MVQKDIDNLNTSADYILDNDLLFGAVKPVFELINKDQAKLSMEPLLNHIKKLGLDPTSLEAKNLEYDYLVDVENIIKRVKSLQ